MRTCRYIFVVGSYLAIFCFSARANEVFKFDPARSTIAFHVRHMLGTARGKFTKFSGTIEFDREHPENSSVIATIRTGSIDTAIAKRDEHLRGADFFNVQKFPEITFRSRQLRQTGPNSGDIVGDLTMHGVTRSITLKVKLVEGSDRQTQRWRVTTAPISRREFGLAWSKSIEAVSMIGDEVAVEIEIEASRAQ
ncbi:MAG TPA: YceI family protein [Chthoniobacterales bacterium]|jgi:polyisoprenoid-binding protein YceI